MELPNQFLICIQTGLLGGKGRVVSSFRPHRSQFRRHGDLGPVRRPASSHRSAFALLRCGWFRLADHDDEEQPHGQPGRGLRKDGGIQRSLFSERRIQARVPKFVHPHRLHPRSQLHQKVPHDGVRAMQWQHLRPRPCH